MKASTHTITSKKKLPVLLFHKIGPDGISLKKLESVLHKLNQRHFSPILPSDFAKTSPLPARPVLLFFANGYRTFFTLAYPLLKKYGLKAAVGLPVGLIGKYDAWQNAEAGPWQDLLTKEDLKLLGKDKNIYFISQGIDNAAPQRMDQANACWQISESKARLERMYDIKTQALFFPKENLQESTVLEEAQTHYSFIIQKGKRKNFLDPAQLFLHIFPVRCSTWIWWLLFKIKQH